MFKPHPKTRNFSDGRFPHYLDKGDYKEPILVEAELLRGNVSFKTPFRLLFKRLRVDDNKAKEFGDCYAGKF